jgi:hypothetical protein
MCPDFKLRVLEVVIALAASDEFSDMSRDELKAWVRRDLAGLDLVAELIAERQRAGASSAVAVGLPLEEE